MKHGWLVNDYLSVLPGRTVWHDLLDWIPGLEDMTGTPFPHLAEKIESKKSRPDYVIRNATYFRWMDLGVPTVSFLQDFESSDTQRIVLENSDVVVFNSKYTESYAKNHFDISGTVIPIGIDFDLFSEGPRTPEGPVLWVGSTANVKGFDILQKVIDEVDCNFEITLKKGSFSHPRVKCHSPMLQGELVELMHKCSMLLCTSRNETQHLAGIEAAATGLPLVVPNVGAYYGLDPTKLGIVVRNWEYAQGIQEVNKNLNPRSYFKKMFSRKECKQAWKNLVESL